MKRCCPLILLLAHFSYGADGPVISSVAVTPRADSAVVTFSTDVPAVGYVVIVDGSGDFKRSPHVANPVLTYTHTVDLPFLHDDRQYKIYAVARDGSGRATSTSSAPTIFKTLPVDASGPLNYSINLIGPNQVTAGSDVYLTLVSAQTSGVLKTRMLFSEVSGLPKEITTTFICSLKDTRPLEDGIGNCTLDFDSKLRAYVTGGYTMDYPVRIRLRVAESAQPMKYRLRITTSAAGVVRSAEHEVTVLPKAIQPQNIRPAEVPPIPGLRKWESNMLVSAKQWCNLQEVMSFGNEQQVWYYDGGRVYYQIADYTGDASWKTCADHILTQHRDEIIRRNGAMQGWRVFPHGLAMRYWRTGEEASKKAAILLAENSAYALSGGTPDASFVRETAYALQAYVKYEQLTGQRHRNLARTVDFIIGDFELLFSKTNPAVYATQPFFLGLAAEALIQYYELTQDPRIPYAIRMLLDWTWDVAWHPQRNQLIVNSISVPVYYNTTMVNLVVPAFGWYYAVTGDDIYRVKGDVLFSNGLNSDVNYHGKIFSQNYRWSIDYVRWRSGGALSGSHPRLSAPRQSHAYANIDAQRGIVTWPTQLPSSSQLEYGSTPEVEVATNIRLQPSTFHQFTIPTVPDRRYYFRTRSVDQDGFTAKSPVETFDTLPELVGGGYLAGAVWADPNTRYRRKVSITTGVPSGQNITVQLRVSDPMLASKAHGGRVATDDGRDIFFADSSGQRLPSEIEHFDAQAGLILAWVRLPSPTASNALYMYYGRSDATKQVSARAWDTTHFAVWHLGPVNSGIVAESTRTGAHAQAVGSTKAVTAAIGSGLQLDVTARSHLTAVAPILSNPGPDFSIQCWINVTSTNHQKIVSTYDIRQNRGYELSIGDGAGRGIVYFIVGDGTKKTVFQTSSPVAVRTWSHLAVVWKSGSATVFLNGAPMAVSGPGTAQMMPSEVPLTIGRSASADAYYLGNQVDELRITSALTPERIMAEYLVQSGLSKIELSHTQALAQ